MMRVFAGIVAVVLCFGSFATAQEWKDRVRGSWVDEANGPGGIRLVDGEKVCEIIVAPTEHSCVQQAAKFLAGDIEKITGKRPAVVAKPTPGHVAVHVDTAKSDDRWEAFDIVTGGNGDLHLIGSNPRGTAFAVYTLCERIGIDPLHHWTGYEPAHRNPLILKPVHFESAPPTVKYRGMFHDDEDILPRPFETPGYPLRTGDVPTEWYAKYFETALRLRMNMVAPYTRVTRRYEVQKLASDWGLFYTSHHYDILLSNPFGIKRYGLAEKRNAGETWDWATNREGMLRFWRGGVEENKDVDCVWPVGMRGTDDTSYKFPKGTSEAEQARVFKEVIDEQVKMTKQLVPPAKQPPVFHWTLYSEMLPKYQAGTLEVPKDVIIVWPDDNEGIMRGLPSKADGWKHGVYYHLAYLGKPVKQNAHIVSPARVAEQFRKIIDSGATEYMLVNVSELREFIMEARMISEICWDAKAALAGAGDDPAKRYVEWWSREYFGDENAKDVAAAYGDYYKLLDTYDKLWLGSDKVQGALGSLVKKFAGQDFSPALPETLPMLEQRDRQYREAFTRFDTLRPKLTRAQRQYFFEHVELPLLMDWRPTQAAILLIRAMAEPDRQRAWSMCESAMEPLEKLEVEIGRAERPPFEQWYRETWIRRGPSPHNLHRPYRELRLFLGSDGCEYEIPDTGRFNRPATTTSTAPSR